MNKIFSRRSLSTRQQIEFTERLSYLLEAGISLLEGLSLIEIQIRSTRSKKVLQKLIKRIGRGESLSSSLSVLRILDMFSVCAIGIGETTGTLSDNLRLITIQLKKRSELKKKLAATMVYPAIILLSTVGLSVFLITVIFPKIRPLFNNLKVTLPFSTRLLIFLGAIPPHVIIETVLALMFFVVVYLFTYGKSIVIRWHVQKTLSYVPILGTLLRDAATIDIFRMLGILLKSDNGLQGSFVIIGDAGVNLIYKNECIEAAEKLERGEQLSDILKKRPRFFAPAIVGFLAIGELTGNISEICLKISTMIESDLDENIKKLSTLVEPALILIMGTIVGFVALAIITPIYAITQNIK